MGDSFRQFLEDLSKAAHESAGWRPQVFKHHLHVQLSFTLARARAESYNKALFKFLRVPHKDFDRTRRAIRATVVEDLGFDPHWYREYPSSSGVRVGG